MKLILTALALLMSTVALADKYVVVTPSGMAETLFPDRPAIVTGKISSKCIDVHWTVTNSTDTEVTCEAPMNFGQSLLGTMLMGNSYSTPPRRFFRFNVAQVNGIVRVQASGWMELQMAFGQMHRTDFSGPEFQNSILGFMVAAGGKLPPGTTFPNHAFIGVKGTLGVAGYQVVEVDSGSPAEKAGVKPGDLITMIAHKKFKNEAQHLDARAKAVETPTYPISIIRNGASLELTVDRAFRPTITEVVVAKPDALITQPVASNLSTADEIGKLATLRDKGVLTAAEFEAQKAKLLAK